MDASVKLVLAVLLRPGIQCLLLGLHVCLKPCVLQRGLHLGNQLLRILKSEFKLTYAGLGPTEFRLAAILLNTLLILIKPWQQFERVVVILGKKVFIHALDYPGLVILAILFLIFLVTIIKDARYYARIDPMPRRKEEK